MLSIDSLPKSLAGCEAVLLGAPRYLELLDPEHPDYHPGYTNLVRAQAGLAPDPLAPAYRAPRSHPAEPEIVLEPSDRFVAPIRGNAPEKPWQGILGRKPWQYRVTAVIVHMDTPELLEAVLATLRAQTLRPYLLVVDTGSLAVNRRKLEQLEQKHEDLEIHYLRSKGYQHSSEPITAANDLAFSLAQTEFVYSTHVDVFLRRRDFLEWLVSLCGPETPAVGYRMSSRQWKTDLWWHCLGHSATCYHLPTWRKIGASWSLARARERLGLTLQESDWGWPDTETAPGLCFRDAGFPIRTLGEPAGGPSVLAIGDEINDVQEDDNLVHVRSTTSHKLYQPATSMARAERLRREVAAAWKRAEKWSELDQRLLASPYLGPIERAKRCEHRGPKAQCGCNELYTCLAGKGDSQARVSLNDCVACVTSAEPLTAMPTAPGSALDSDPAEDLRPAPA
ncbi:MAG TPA: hypothetical protein VN719_09595 [Gemmatimonadales bacterium]|nr:hypothetical protein [Gemmatimonadales bacterium]